MAKSNELIKKVCEWCGNIFYAQKVTTRYCSHTCNSRSYKANKRKERVKAAEALTYRTIQEKPIEQLKDRPFLSIAETATLLGLSLQGVYKQIYAGRLRASKITSRLSVVRREDIERMLAERPYEKRQPRDAIVITELYTTDEVCDIHNISRSSLFAIAKRENIPRTYNRGKTYWSKRHIDAYFAKQAPASHIEEWCTAVEIQERFDMTLTAVYNFVSDHNIPRKKVKGKSYYSTKYVEAAKGVLDKAAPSYYTVREAMEKFGLTRDQIYQYTKRYNVPKLKLGRNVLISQQELDEVLKPPSITR